MPKPMIPILILLSKTRLTIGSVTTESLNLQSSLTQSINRQSHSRDLVHRLFRPLQQRRVRRHHLGDEGLVVADRFERRHRRLPRNVARQQVAEAGERA